MKCRYDKPFPKYHICGLKHDMLDPVFPKLLNSKPNLSKVVVTWGPVRVHLIQLDYSMHIHYNLV